MENLPLINITFRQMEHSVTHAFTDAQIQTDEMFKRACERAFNPANIEKIINDQVNAAAADILKDEIKGFFSYGDGSRELRKNIKSGLAEILARESD